MGLYIRWCCSVKGQCHLHFTVICLSIIALCASSHAASLSHVGGATVTQGKLGAELRAGFTADDDSSRADNRFRMRQHLDYGVSEHYALRLVTSQNKFDNDGLDHADIRVENRFHLIEREQYGWDGGVRLTYIQRDSAADTIRARLTAQGALDDRWEWRHNTLLAHDVGSDAKNGIALEFRSQITYDLQIDYGAIKSSKVGIDMFNNIGRLDSSDFDEQSHDLGVIAKIAMHNKFYTHIGYRHGISDKSADKIFKLAIGRSF